MLRLFVFVAIALSVNMFYAPRIWAEEVQAVDVQNSDENSDVQSSGEQEAAVIESAPESAPESASEIAAEKWGGDKNAASKEDAPKLDPEVRKLNTDLMELTKDLDDARRRHFYMIYNSNNLISTVKYVREHVGEAVQACGENNPDMKTALDERYKVWTDAMAEKLSAAEAQVNNMILAQDYALDKDIRSIMKQADDLRDKTQKGVERIPVTSKEACDYLLNKMDETQKNMTQLLETVLVTMPQAVQQEDFGTSAAQ